MARKTFKSNRTNNIVDMSKSYRHYNEVHTLAIHLGFIRHEVGDAVYFIRNQYPIVAQSKDISFWEETRTELKEIWKKEVAA